MGTAISVEHCHKCCLDGTYVVWDEVDHDDVRTFFYCGAHLPDWATVVAVCQVCGRAAKWQGGCGRCPWEDPCAITDQRAFVRYES